MPLRVVSIEQRFAKQQTYRALIGMWHLQIINQQKLIFDQTQTFRMIS